MKKIFLTSICFFSIFANSIAQTTVVLTPNADAAEGFHDNFGSAGNNYGTVDNEQAMWQPGASGGINGSRTVINFDLSSIPNGTTITSAKLNLYGHGSFGSSGQAATVGDCGTNSCYLQRITSAWNELTTTWNTQPTTSVQNEVTLAQSTSVSQDYLNIDVTQLVQDMLDNPTQSFGFELRLVDESLPFRALDFCSREYSDSSKHPLLSITYSCSNATQYVLTPNADAAEGFHDNFGSAGNNYGTVDNEQAMWQPGASGGINGSRTVINFDLSSIPSGITISSAKLNLYGHGSFGSSGQAATVGDCGLNSCYLQRVTSVWNELTTTWNTQPTTSAQNQVTLAQSTSVDQDYLNIDVTQLVQDMLDNPTQSLGFELRLVDESLPFRALDFCSREYSDSSKHPLLTVTVCGNGESINEDNLYENQISVYPNPTNEIITVSLASNNIVSTKTIFSIYNCYGQKVLEAPISKAKSQFNLNSFDGGIYFYSVSTEGKITKQGKLIVN